MWYCFPPQLCYIGEDTPKMLLLVNAARPQAPETFVVEATAFPGAMRFGELLVACQRAWPYSQVPADPNLTSCRFISVHFISCYFIHFIVIELNFMLFRVISFHFISLIHS